LSEPLAGWSVNVFGLLNRLVERFEPDQRRQVLGLLAERPMRSAELASHFRLPLLLGWHLRELDALGLVAYNRRAGRYHLVGPAVERLANLGHELVSLVVLSQRPAHRGTGPQLARAERLG
jgi:hypothetical protein